MSTNVTTSTRPAFFRRLALVATALTALGFASVATVTPAFAAPKGEVASAKPVAAAEDEAESANGTVNLNTATETELTLLPGVGPSKAAAILAFRKKYGAFKKVEDLNKVKGFGYKTLKKLKPYLSLTGATTYKGKAKKAPTHGEAVDTEVSAAP